MKYSINVADFRRATPLREENGTVQKLSPIYEKKLLLKAQREQTSDNISKKRKRKKSGRSVPKDLREQILERDNFRCQSCGDDNHLQVHHIKHRCDGGSNSPDNLITLCEKCHYEMHKDEPVGKLMKKHMDNLI